MSRSTPCIEELALTPESFRVTQTAVREELCRPVDESGLQAFQDDLRWFLTLAYDPEDAPDALPLVREALWEAVARQWRETGWPPPPLVMDTLQLLTAWLDDVGELLDPSSGVPVGVSLVG